MAFSLFSMVLSAVMTLDLVAPTAALPDATEVASSMVEVLLMGLMSVVAKTDLTWVQVLAMLAVLDAVVVSSDASLVAWDIIDLLISSHL